MIRWEKQKQHSDAWYLYSGDLIIGMVVQVTSREEKPWKWSLNAVHYKYICKGSGETKNVETAKRNLSRAWGLWCKEAGLKVME